jgi:hypothetical protein
MMDRELEKKFQSLLNELKKIIALAQKLEDEKLALAGMKAYLAAQRLYQVVQDRMIND